MTFDIWCLFSALISFRKFTFHANRPELKRSTLYHCNTEDLIVAGASFSKVKWKMFAGSSFSNERQSQITDEESYLIIFILKGCSRAPPPPQLDPSCFFNAPQKQSNLAGEEMILFCLLQLACCRLGESCLGVALGSVFFFGELTAWVIYGWGVAQSCLDLNITGESKLLLSSRFSLVVADHQRSPVMGSSGPDEPKRPRTDAVRPLMRFMKLENGAQRESCGLGGWICVS